MLPKKGKVLPKMGKVLHRATGDDDPELKYASAIAAALRQELGMTHQSVKSAMRWTGASERTVKYWFAGTIGPSGEHLIALARHSDMILDVFLRKAGRPHYAGAVRLVVARETLKEILEIIQSLIEESADS